MYVIIGLGTQGEAILKYLLKVTKEEIISFDINDVYLAHLSNARWKHYKVVGDNEWEDIIENRDDCETIVVINCLPTEYNLEITKTCIAHGWNLVDLGGVTSVVRRQFKLDRLAKRENISIVPDCGLAPGINISLAAQFNSEGADSVEAFCGGIPKYPKPPLSYCKAFHPAGVIKEYSGVSYERKNGSIVSRPALSGKELIHVSGFGVLEAARTSGGVSISPEHLSLRNYSYKTLRYPGHWDYVQKYIMPQKDPVQVLNDLIEPVTITNPDVIILYFVINRGEEIVEFFWEYDDGISAMAQATGYTVAATSTMIHDKLIKCGVIGMHEIAAKEIIRRVRLLDNKQFSSEQLIF